MNNRPYDLIDIKELYAHKNAMTGPSLINCNIYESYRRKQYEELQEREKKMEKIKATTESLFKKWLSRNFYQFLDGNIYNIEESNLRPVHLEQIIREWPKIVSNALFDLTREELRLVNDKEFRKSLYFQ
jgi:hypothetical protein